MTLSSRSEPAEKCGWCKGTGKMLASANFLLARLGCHDDYRWVGRSSDAMVIAAITGEEPDERPYDGWDLGRCMVTRAVAPECLHAAMDAILAEWTSLIEREDHYHGLEAARGMVEQYEASVRARIEEQ